MREGLARIEGPIVLIGNPEYYTRFGFRPAAPLGLVRFPAPFGP